MNSQRELFPAAGIGFTPAPERNQPAVWIRELLLLRDFKPGNEQVIRRIKLRPGLNILWARPGPARRKQRLGQAGVYGHASGKTTFCRLVRHLLGEKHFGNSELQARIRSHFRGGWDVGEVILAGEPWLVCRPFTLGVHPFVVRGATIDRLFDDGLNREPIQVYLDALNQTLVVPLPVATFATSPESIEWPHLIQWLARDQECRFAELTDFRHKSSEAESPEMEVEDRHFLFRAVVGLIDNAEQEELERNKVLIAKKQAAEKRAPLLRHQAKVALDRLRSDLPELHSDAGGGIFLDAARQALATAAANLAAQIGELQEPAALKEARAGLTNAEAAVQMTEARKQELQGVIEGLQKELQALRGEITQQELNSYWQSKNTGEKLCLEPLARAIGVGCPLAVGRTLVDDSGRVAVKVERKADDLEQALLRQQKELRMLEAAIADQQRKVAIAQTVVDSEQQRFIAVRDGLLEKREKTRGLLRRVKEAQEDENEAEKLEESLVNWEKDIRKSQERQTELRRQHQMTLGDFSRTFDRVVKAVLGTEVEAAVHFEGRQVSIHFEHRGELTSAAIDTIKILAFDLASLISSVEGRGFHPRLLVHDGPREADMAAALYQRIFLLAWEVEKAFGKDQPNFQYIVTTTEPPPSELQNPPWLLDPILDASNPEGRLFKEDL
jgi:hypothetical protein